ncbi:hypothetical protein AQZ52_02025 [Novosphingobium fuchskuhlense]|uniref:Uncharacterized protein n=1 Tax=Novosphingobium fuchskuhlense TaxID=1117702 RepID=A0A124JVB2_9SPHN|nr:hypothetical protein [Novosphingobium fuchskuhlense]KUR72108.1 hypothetical protein AQZ52_02025 [Novosphingobium fuchskuhlense]
MIAGQRFSGRVAVAYVQGSAQKRQRLVITQGFQHPAWPVPLKKGEASLIAKTSPKAEGAMQGNEKQAISGRWWFKLLRNAVSGIANGLALAWRGWGKLGMRGKIGVLAALAILFVIAGITGHRDKDQAQSLGFASVAEMREADKAGFHDKASWSKHLADVAAQAQAAEAAKAQEAKNRSAEEAASSSNGKTLGQWMDEQALAARATNSEKSESSAQTADTGPGSKPWRARVCKAWASANLECVSGNNYDQCVSSRMVMALGPDERNAGLGAANLCNEDGSVKF